VTIYLVGGKSVGGFMRANSERDSSSNLNSRGMVFKKFCISEIRQNQDHAAKEAVYSVIARLSTLAGARELKEIL
jgi:glutamate--cysteine ligase